MGDGVVENSLTFPLAEALAGRAEPAFYPGTKWGVPLGQHTVFHPWQMFKGATMEAFRLGIAPPKSPAPEDLLEYEKRAGPLLEQKLLQAWPGHRPNAPPSWGI